MSVGVVACACARVAVRARVAAGTTFVVRGQVGARA